MEAAKKYEWKDHPHLVICAVKDERRLQHDLDKLNKLGIDMIVWREPDMNNSLTAIASPPISNPEDRYLFRNFQLLKETA